MIVLPLSMHEVQERRVVVRRGRGLAPRIVRAHRERASHRAHRRAHLHTLQHNIIRTPTPNHFVLSRYSQGFVVSQGNHYQFCLLKCNIVANYCCNWKIASNWSSEDADWRTPIRLNNRLLWRERAQRCSGRKLPISSNWRREWCVFWHTQCKSVLHIIQKMWSGQVNVNDIFKSVDMFSLKVPT